MFGTESTPWKVTGLLHGRQGQPRLAGQSPGRAAWELRVWVPQPRGPLSHWPLPRSRGALTPPPSQGRAGTHRQCTMVRPSPLSACHLSSSANRRRKAFLESGVSRYADQRRNWKCRTSRCPSCSWRCGQSARGHECQGLHGPLGTSRGSFKATQPPPRFSSWSSQITHPRDVLHPENAGHQVLVRCA